MNLFYLDENLDKCAEYHVDKHIVKMPLEVAQRESKDKTSTPSGKTNHTILAYDV